MNGRQLLCTFNIHAAKSARISVVHSWEKIEHGDGHIPGLDWKNVEELLLTFKEDGSV